MRLNNLPVAVKLWGVVLGSMGAMLTLAFSLLVFAESTAEQVNAKTQAADVRIATTMRWKALTELSVERVVVSAMSSESVLVQEMKALSAQGIARISELQKEVEAQADSEQEKVQLAVVAGNRAKALEAVAKINRAREELRGQVAKIAVAGAEKVLGREIDANAHRDLLGKLASEL